MKPTKNLKEELETIEECLKIYLMLWELQIYNTYENLDCGALAKEMLQEKKERVNKALSEIKNAMGDR